jgi:hypothetical protein
MSATILYFPGTPKPASQPPVRINAEACDFDDVNLTFLNELLARPRLSITDVTILCLRTDYQPADGVPLPDYLSGLANALQEEDLLAQKLTDAELAQEQFLPRGEALKLAAALEALAEKVRAMTGLEITFAG